MFYIAVCIVSFLFAYLCRNSKGFGLAYHYEKAQGNDLCTIACWYEYTQNDLGDFVLEKTGERPEWISMYIEIGSRDGIQSKDPMSDESVEIIDKYRKLAIEDFYENNYRNSKGSNILIYDRVRLNQYHYNLDDTISIADALKLAKDPSVMVHIDTDRGSYLLNSDGDLILQEAVVYGNS